MTKQLLEKPFRFIPYRKHDLVDMCLQDQQLQGQEPHFRQLYVMLSCVFHFEFQQIIESLKDCYASIDPDADTRSYVGAKRLTDTSFSHLLNGLLEKANYQQITQTDLNQALSESSVFKIRLHVDFDDFAEVLLFCRGQSTRNETLSSWFGLRTQSISFTNYDRVVVYLRFKDDYPPSKHPSPSCKSGSTLLKLFQNVPKADLEMLFPNTQVRMRTIDKLLIGVPAMISGGIVLTTKLSASLVLMGSMLGFWLGLGSQPVEINKASIIVLLAGFFTLGGYLWKQWSNFKNRKLQFMQELTQNLYFKNLDNNAGVFYRHGNDAEEEETKEALLAYYFLLVSERPLLKEELDHVVEQWLLTQWQCHVDFEIDDALNKLETLSLVRQHNGYFSAVGLDDALKVLDKRWDAYFIT